MNSNLKKIVMTALFAALACVATMSIRIPTPGTGGYIHPGDAIVILSGVVLGPSYGLLADIVRLKDAISGGYNWNPLAGLGMGFVLNIIMFLPLGLLIPCIWKQCRNITNVAVTGFLLSLTIEISQIFNARATDIDDLLANTIGACAGYLIWRGIYVLVCGKQKEKGDGHVENPIEADGRKWEPMIYLALAFSGAFFLYNPYVQ